MITELTQIRKYKSCLRPHSSKRKDKFPENVINNTRKQINFQCHCITDISKNDFLSWYFAQGRMNDCKISTDQESNNINKATFMVK